MNKFLLGVSIFLSLLLWTGISKQGLAQTSSGLTTQAAQMDSLAASQGQSKVVGKISSDFSYFLQKVDGPAVVSGLRNGQWTYSTPSSTPTGAPTTTTVPLPTGKTGYGNTYISLALAKHRLSQYGITQPTQSELQAALVGGQITKSDGTTVDLKGILTMRSEGMGFGQIAQQSGSKLGPIVSSMKKANQSIAVASSSSKGSGVVNAAGQSTGSSGSGVVSGSGKAHGNSGQGVSGKNSSGAGIVNASGKSMGNGNAYGYGKGIVTGSGQAGGASGGVTTAGGQGNSGQAKGHNK
jgi:hypothetical protein